MFFLLLLMTCPNSYDWNSWIVLLFQCQWSNPKRYIRVRWFKTIQTHSKSPKRNLFPRWSHATMFVSEANECVSIAAIRLLSVTSLCVFHDSLTVVPCGKFFVAITILVSTWEQNIFPSNLHSNWKHVREPGPGRDKLGHIITRHNIVPHGMPEWQWQNYKLNQMLNPCYIAGKVWCVYWEY